MNMSMTYGIKKNLTRFEAASWASRRWGVPARTHRHLNEHSIEVVDIEVTYNGVRYVGHGCATDSATAWWAAAVELAKQESTAVMSGH